MRDEFEKWRNSLQDRPTDTTEWEFEIWKAGALAMRERAAKTAEVCDDVESAARFIRALPVGE